jgi:hypothetical protein
VSALALGFRVKSGYAIAVALRGSAPAPEILARYVVALSDPKVAATKQPYHDGFGTAQENIKEIARLTRTIERCAAQSVSALLEEALPGNGPCRGASLVVGSTIDPSAVGNPHIRAHASEGRLFRTVLEDALRERGVDCTVIVEKMLTAHAVRALGRPEREIKKVVGAFGEMLDGPWRVDEKAAATAAWVTLARSGSAR